MDLLDNIDPDTSRLDELVEQIIGKLTELPNDGARVEALNRIRLALHEVSPLRHEPVDCVQWVRAERVQANDYNPNTVAPPEMELLRHSITEDGYTQPIVTWATDGGLLEVVDGFHRHRVGRECAEVRDRVLHFLPVVVANDSRTDRGDRIASTIRHNRARGKHRIDGMSAIVVELKRRNWSDEKIGRELGMDPDEVLRLAQISGLAEMFAERDFSEAWEIGAISETDTLDVDDEAGQ
jgi:ParB-like chromosome segregation protein Spo0J